MPEIIEEYEEENGTFKYINGIRCLVEKSQAFIDRNVAIVQAETIRKSDSDIYALIRARSNRRADITSITEAFDAGLLNTTKRNRGLQIVEDVWQVAVAKFQSLE